MKDQEEPSADEPKSGEVLEPHDPDLDNPVGDNYIALISQYTERPDLLIDALERHDPGFVKLMNLKAAQNSERMSNARYWFGGIQAYTGLVVSVIAALTVVGLLAFAVINGTAAFPLILGLVLFYAVSQGGPSGFLELCRGIADFIRRKSDPKD